MPCLKRPHLASWHKAAHALAPVPIVTVNDQIAAQEHFFYSALQCAAFEQCVIAVAMQMFGMNGLGDRWIKQNHIGVAAHSNRPFFRK
jgi:hypothetical protein